MKRVSAYDVHGTGISESGEEVLRGREWTVLFFQLVGNSTQCVLSHDGEQFRKKLDHQFNSLKEMRRSKETCMMWRNGTEGLYRPFHNIFT